MPLLGDTGHSELIANFKHLGATLPKPTAIVVASAHFEVIRTRCM
jgi:aromatic ring-opening dioxygenase catalytic subunit (LigB family)